MQRYAALLRGVNVGGKNKISMPVLKAVFEESGFRNVSTYINSGNVIFTCSISDKNEIQRICETAIKKRFGLNISVAVISADELSEAMQNAPEWWDADSDSKHNAIFVIQPATSDEVMKQAGEAKPEYEHVGAYGRVIFWSAPLKTFSRTRWSKIVGTSAYDSITIRNANTAKRLFALLTS